MPAPLVTPVPRVDACKTHSGLIKTGLGWTCGALISLLGLWARSSLASGAPARSPGGELGEEERWPGTEPWQAGPGAGESLCPARPGLSVPARLPGRLFPPNAPFQRRK